MRSLGCHTDQVEQALPRLSTLTKREREVVEHLVGGVSDREIARSLAISQRTVHKHLERIYRKLGLGSRTSLIAVTHRADDTNLSAGVPASNALRPAPPGHCRVDKVGASASSVVTHTGLRGTTGVCPS